MGNLLKIVLLLSLSTCLIFDINGEKFKKETKLDIPNGLGTILHEPLQRFYQLKESSPSDRKDHFIRYLNDFKCQLDQTCGFWERDYYQVSIDCRKNDPCAISKQAFEIVDELFHHHDNLNEVTSALGNMVRPETFIKLAEVMFGLPNLSKNKPLPIKLKLNLEDWKLEKNPKDTKLQRNIKEIVADFVKFQQRYGDCLNLEYAEEFMYNHEEFVKKIEYAQYKRMMDASDELAHIADVMKEILMDLAVVLSAEKAQ